MKISQNSKKTLLRYIKNNEVVYQVYGELVEVSNDNNIDNRNALIEYFNQSSSIELYTKDDEYIREPFSDLNDWATSEDQFFLLEKIGVLICISKKCVIKNHIVEGYQTN